MTERIAITALPKGASATIAAIDDADAALADQLSDHGFLPGETIEVLGSGLFGGTPVAVRLGRAMVALRRHEAEAVKVERG